MKHWYYLDNRQQKIGPLSDAQLDVLFHQGKITVDTLVWNQEMSDWQPLKDCSDHKSETDRATRWNIFLNYCGGWLSIIIGLVFISAGGGQGKGGETAAKFLVGMAILVFGLSFFLKKIEKLERKKKQVENLLNDSRQ